MTIPPSHRPTAIERLLAPWFLRGAFALLLFSGWQLILGRAVFQRDIIDLLAILLGCLAVAALLLDLLERFMVRDAFAALLVMGIGGLLAFTLLDMRPPEDIFLALASRGLGAYTVFALLMLSSLLWVARAGRWRLLAWVLPASIVAGLWARWMPYEAAPTSEGGLGLGVAALLWIAAAQVARQGAALPAATLRLTPPEALATLGLLIASVSGRTDARLPEPLTGAIALTLIMLCLVILWFQRKAKGDTFAGHLTRWEGVKPGISLAPPVRVVGWISVVALGAALGWLMPRGAGSGDPVAIVGTFFTAFGLVWLPTVALVYGWRALRRDVRALRL